MPNVFTSSSRRYDKVHSIMLVSFVWIHSKLRRADLFQDQKRVSAFSNKKKVFAQRSDFYLFSVSVTVPSGKGSAIEVKCNSRY